MKIVIDTKEDIHILRHVINLLHAVSTATGARKYYDNHDSNSGSGFNNLFSDAPSSVNTSSSPQLTPEASTSLFSMFDTPSANSSSAPSGPDSFASLFGGETEKKDEDKKDFLDSLQVY